MMRIVLLLLLALSIAAVLAFYPDIAQHDVRFEAFGWVAELNQAVFILILLTLLILLWVVRKILSAFLAGPSRLWRNLVSGKHRRREENLREGISQLIDQRRDMGGKAFGKSRGIVPDWAMDLIQTLTIPLGKLSVDDAGQDRLKVALHARLATDPQTSELDAGVRKKFLDAWLQASPDAPLAINRSCKLAEEMEDWPTAVRLLEDKRKIEGGANRDIRERLLNAYLNLAAIEQEEEFSWIHKAQKLDPDSHRVILALGAAHVRREDTVAARRLWNRHLKRHDSYQIARSLFEITEDYMRAYRKMESESAQTMHPSRQWLRAQLAHTAGLSGLANRHMQKLIERHPGQLAWQTWGGWHVQAQEWKLAANCYAEALKTKHKA